MTGINNTQSLFGGEIQPTGTPSVSSAGGRAGTSSLAKTDTDSANAAGQVRVSSAAGALLNAGSDVRMDKVTQLQAAIAGGTYNVSSADVTNKLIDSMLGG
jgi:flagellar biosynthesis anti-sigma factor FlgM